MSSTKKRTQPKRQAKKAKVKYTGCGINQDTGRCKKGERKGRRMCDLNSKTNRCNYSKVWRETSRICALNDKTGRCAKGADGKRRGCELGENGWCKKVKKVVRKRKAAPASSKKQPASKKKKVVKKKAEKKPASKKKTVVKKKAEKKVTMPRNFPWRSESAIQAQMAEMKDDFEGSPNSLREAAIQVLMTKTIGKRGKRMTKKEIQMLTHTIMKLNKRYAKTKKPAPKKKAAKKPRKSPSESAKTHPVGTKKEGNDKNMYVVTKRVNGSMYWKKCK